MSIESIEGTATVQDPPGSREAPVVVLDGPVVTATMERMESGYSGRPLPREEVEEIRNQAGRLIADVLKAYDATVARHEVGLNGSARAAVDQVRGDDCPTGLLYGRVQSGKTNAMILAAALAFDNGFRTVVVTTTDNVALVKQTAARFRVLDDGPLVYASTSGQWELDADNIARHLSSNGVVFVCSKNAAHISSLIATLQRVTATEYPALIFDDEADQGSLDTTTAKRNAGGASAPSQGSTTFRLLMTNDAPQEAGESIRESLRHNVFVQVTATPYALLLQNTGSPSRPTFTRLLEPGTGYTGGDHFFSRAQVVSAGAPLVMVDPNETTGITAGAQQTPEGLARAIAFFLLGATSLEVQRRKAEPEGYKLLCHTSPKQGDHDVFAQAIRAYVDRLVGDDGNLATSQRHHFEWAYAELSRTVQSPPSFEELERRLVRRLPQRKVLVVNAAADPTEFGSAYNFLIGGNILGRGLTIDNLLVTYYLRMPRTTQMDTMLQHARMFGYRAAIMPFTRVFLSQMLAARFNQITETEAALREMLTSQPSDDPIPVQVVGNLRATRANVLDANAIGGIRAGQQCFPAKPATSPDQVGNSTERIEAMLAEIFGVPWYERKHEYVDCSLEQLVQLVSTVRNGDPDGEDWDPDILAPVLRSISAIGHGRAAIFVRDFRTEREVIIGGALDSVEHDRARKMGKPVLYLMHEPGEHRWPRPFWYPGLVFPKNMPNQVFNVT